MHTNLEKQSPNNMNLHSRTVEELASELEQRRRLGERPHVLLLGAGASVRAGLADMRGIYRAASLPNPEADDAFDRFCKYIAQRNARERYLLLAQHLETVDPFVVTPGYRALAALCANGFLDLVLTANLDPLLDDALACAQLRRRDYLLIVNGMIRPDLLGPMLDGHRPRVKVIKLHGDLFARQMAWTPVEMKAYLDGIWGDLSPAIQTRDFLVAGYSLRDKRVQDLVFGAEGSLWFTHPKEVPGHLLPLFKKHRERVRTVIGPEAAFEEFFCRLAQILGVGSEVPAPAAKESGGTRALARGALATTTPSGRRRPAAERAETAGTLDDFLGAIVGVAGPSGEVVMTGFALAEPRVIVSDGYVGNTDALNLRRIPLVTALGTRLVTHSLGIAPHPFGPMWLTLPEEFRLPRLRVSTAPLQAGMPIQVGVAAGDRRGVARGEISTGIEVSLAIAPLPGEVPHLIELRCAVAPGASGAPVVNDKMEVVGFIVAGSSDLKNPKSFMYPARRWVRQFHDLLPEEVV